VDSNPVEPESGSPISPNKHTKRKGAKRELKSKNQQQFGKLRIYCGGSGSGNWQASYLSNLKCFVELYIVRGGHNIGQGVS
jgi:hypothetical protein